MAAPYSIFNSVLRALQRAWSRSPANKMCREAAVHPTLKGPRGGKRYVCADCGKDFATKGMDVDHIDPTIPIGTPAKSMSWDQIIERLDFEGTSGNHQCICKPCHRKKSKGETKERKEARKKAKGK